LLFYIRILHDRILIHIFFIIIRSSITNTLFPYTTLFRSKSREACTLSEWYYRRAFAPGDRIIVENDCLILHVFQMSTGETREVPDRKSTRLNSHVAISYAVFCLKKKNKSYTQTR